MRRDKLSSQKHMQAILARMAEETRQEEGRESSVDGYLRYGDTLVGNCSPSILYHSTLFHA